MPKKSEVFVHGSFEIAITIQFFRDFSVEITTTMRYLFSGNLSLKSPLQILSLIDLSFDNYR